VVTFTGLGVNINGFGEAFLDKERLSAIHFISKWSHWWQPDEVREAAEVARSLIKRSNFQDVITYGASMGGYGAALYSRAFEASRVVMIAPQYSIDPRKMPKEKRWIAEARKIGDFPDDDMNQAISRSAKKFIVYDPVSDDMDHVARYLRYDNVVEVVTPFAGHVPGLVLNEIKIFKKTILGLFDEKFDRVTFSREYRATRRQSWNYWYSWCDVAMKRRLDRALCAAKRAVSLNESSDLAIRRLCDIQTRMGDIRAAISTIRMAIAAAPDVDENYSRLAGLCMMTKEYDEALGAIRSAIDLSPKNTVHIRRLSHIHVLMKNFPEAILHGERALELDPSDVSAIMHLTGVFLQAGLLDDCEKVVRRGLSGAPQSGDLMCRLSEVYERRGDIDNAYRWARDSANAQPRDDREKRAQALHRRVVTADS